MADVPASDRLTAFMARLTDDAEFTSAVAADPKAVAADAGLSDTEQALVVWAVQRFDRARQHHALVERARVQLGQTAMVVSFLLSVTFACGVVIAVAHVVNQRFIDRRERRAPTTLAD